VALAVAAGLGGWWAARGFAGRTPMAPAFLRLSFQRGVLGNARFGPDGQTVVYGFNPALLRGVTQLFLTRPPSPESKPFEFMGDILSIARSGDLAIFQQTGASAEGTLAVAPMVGGTPRRLVENVLWAGADWDPNGKGLAVVRMVGGTGRLEFPIGRVLVPRAVEGLRFSADGREIAFWETEIAFWETESGDSRLSVIDRDGKNKAAFSSGWFRSSGSPCWSADGREIWFTAWKAGETDSLWAARRSGEVRRVARVPGSLELYDVSRDGRVLMAHHTIVWPLRGLAPGQSTEVDLSWLDRSSPSDLSSDGTTLLITEDGEGAGNAPVVYTRTTDGAPATRIGEGEAVALSPDNQWVLATRKDRGRKRFWLLPTGPGDAKPLSLEGLDAGWGAFLPGGRQIVFAAASGADGPSRLYVADVGGGKPRPFTPEGVHLQPFASPVSPDGRRVVGVRKGQFLIYRIDGPGEPQVVAGFSPPLDRLVQWSSDSRSLFAYNQTTRPIQVDLIDVETGEKRPWRQIPVDETWRQVRVRVTPSGNAYVFGATSIISELYLVEGLR
ncbi:MAG: hypothetical protein WAU32_05170, partial [Thermoanaerobaculia bacterium]